MNVDVVFFLDLFKTAILRFRHLLKQQKVRRWCCLSKQFGRQSRLDSADAVAVLFANADGVISFFHE